MFNIHCGCGCSNDTDITGIFTGSNFSIVQGSADLLDLDLSKVFITLTNYLTEVFTVNPSAQGIATVNTLVAGTGYTNGTYFGVPLTGGTGASALATIIVASGVVSSVAITVPGYGYTIGDVLSAVTAVGSGSGFSVTVATLVPPVALDYANVAGTPNEAKLVIIIPQYDSSLEDYPSQQVIQWRFQGTSTWSNIGPFMFLSGAQNPLTMGSNSNNIGPIEFQNLTTKPIRLKILLGV